MSYENRIALGNLVPTISQFKVMDKIPQYQQCEVHNLVEAPAEVPEVLRHVVFNIERGQTLHETIDFLNMCPDFKNMDIIYANELDDGAVRSGNCNVAYEIAKSIGMNYAYGLEFIELVNPNDNKGFHGNALFSRWPIRWAKVVHMPEQYNWYYDRQKRIGARVAIVCSLDIGGREVGAVSVHLENRADSEGREAQMAVVYDEIKKSFAPDTPVMIGGDLNTNTFDGNDIPGFTKLFNDPERLAKHMAAVEKYERVLPQVYRSQCYVSAAELTGAIERASLVTEDRLGGNSKPYLKLTFARDHIEIYSVSSGGSIEESVPAALEGDEVIIGFTCRLLLDTLRAVPSDTETLRLRLNSPIMGITIESAALPPLCNASPDPEVFGDRVLDTPPTEKPDGDVLESMYLVMPTRMNK